MQLHFKTYTRLTEEEARVVLPQRNAPKCRKQMFNSHEVSEQDHFDFIRRLTQRKDCAYWAVVIDGEIQGGVYLQDIHRQEAVPGIFMQNIGVGMGALAAYYAHNHYFCTLGLQRLIIHVLKGNHHSMQMHLKFGYTAAPQYTIQNGDKIFCGLELRAEAWKTHQFRLARMLDLFFPAKSITWDDVRH